MGVSTTVEFARIEPLEGSLSQRLRNYQPPGTRCPRRAPSPRLRILHLLSQQPGKTGSGVALLAVIGHAAEAGYLQRAVVGIPAASPLPGIPPLTERDVFAVRFGREGIPFAIPGMSDIMPYRSTRFSTFDRRMLESYLQAFAVCLCEAVRGFEPDIIHSNHLWLVSALARHLFADTPVCVSSHGTELRQLQNAAHLSPFVIPACSDVDLVFALHAENRDCLVEAYGLPAARVRIVGAGFRDDLFKPAAACVPVAARDELIIAYAGKISAPKGVPWLIDAMRLVKVPSGKRVKLLLAGAAAGSGLEEIKRRAAGLENVVFLGALSQESLAEMLQSADVFVLPSFFEGLPLVVVEALACGCRAVVTDLPGLDSWLPAGLREEEYVSAVPLPRLIGTDVPEPDDLGRFTRNLADAISRQLENALRCGSATGAACRVAPLSWKTVFERVDEGYRQMTGI